METSPDPKSAPDPKAKYNTSKWLLIVIGVAIVGDIVNWMKTGDSTYSGAVLLILVAVGLLLYRDWNTKRSIAKREAEKKIIQ